MLERSIDALAVTWDGAEPLVPLWGRRREQAALDQVLADIRAGRSRVLVVSGEPGIGKTALLDDFSRRARDVTVIRALGIESESELAFAGLHQVCSQTPQDKLELLSRAQREAIQVALGSGFGEAPSPLVLGTAMLNHFADIAEERPVLVVIDDAQWLDRATAQTLAFVARRLDSEALALVFASREPHEQLNGLPQLALTGLATADAHKLLASALVAPVDEQIREQFIAETVGNPLAILELSHTLPWLNATQNTSRHPDSKGLWAELEAAFQHRIDGLSGPSRSLSLIAAAEPLGDPAVLWLAADLLRVPRAGADELESAGLLHIGVRTVFRHPLVRSAIYRHAEPAARRRVHAALAEAAGQTLDPDRRAWHRALASHGPDEEIAEELERSAVRATRRGGLGAAAAFLERAVILSGDIESRARRALAAAEAKLDAGQPQPADELLALTKLATQSDLEVARRELLEARLAYTRGRGREAPALLLSAAMRLDSLGGESSRDMYLRAMTAVLFAGHLSAETSVGDVAAAARASPAYLLPGIRDLHIRMMAAFLIEGHAAGAPLARQMVAALRSHEYSDPDDVVVFAASAPLGAFLWDDAMWVELTSRGLQLAQNLGCFDVIPLALAGRVGTHIAAGEFASAAALVHESKELSDATGIPFMPYPAVALAAYGPHEQAFELIHAVRPAAIERGEGLAVTFCDMTEAIVCNALGRYEDAWRLASSAYSDRLLYFPYLLGELVESAVRSGHPERAAAARADLSARAAAANTNWAWGIEKRSEAFFNDGPDAERLYQASIEHLQRTQMRVQLARGHLLYGEWLRREGRRVDARDQLRTAHGMFDAIGALVYTERAMNELAATGETAHKRSVAHDHDDDLTAREAQIARLAAIGLSNREIGERLFISHRTVGYHLAKVFLKLDVTSRALIREDMLEGTLDGDGSH